MAKEAKELTVTRARPERMAPAHRMGEIARSMDDIFGRGWMQAFPFDWDRWESAPMQASAGPCVNVIDHDDEVIVQAEVPGFKKEELDVSISDRWLTIRGETHAMKKDEQGQYYRCEISHGGFSRTINLPAAVDETKAKASMSDGLLELHLPKLEKSRRHPISIS
jgi:HSP20 family protein